MLLRTELHIQGQVVFIVPANQNAVPLDHSKSISLCEAALVTDTANSDLQSPVIAPGISCCPGNVARKFAVANTVAAD